MSPCSLLNYFRILHQICRTGATTKPNGKNKTGRLDQSRPVSFVTSVQCLRANLDRLPLVACAFDPDLALSPVTARR